MTAKLVRDGKVAVLISPGFGAGWYTWINEPWALYDPVIVQMLELGLPDVRDKIVAYCNVTYGEDHYYGGVDDLCVVWLDEGTKFYVKEYDGSESVVRESSMKWEVA